MKKKYVSLFTLIVFSVFTFSCSMYTKLKMQREGFEEISSKKKQKLKILQVVKTNGEVIKFVKKKRGRIVNNSIMGGALEKVKGEKITEVDRKNIKKIMRFEKEPDILITKDGQEIRFYFSKEEKDKIILFKSFETVKRVTIPFSEIKLVRYKRFSWGKAIILSFGGVLIVFPILFLILRASGVFV